MGKNRVSTEKIEFWAFWQNRVSLVNQKKNFELFLKKQRATALCFKKPNVLLPYILDFENLSKSITRKIMVVGI